MLTNVKEYGGWVTTSAEFSLGLNAYILAGTKEYPNSPTLLALYYGLLTDLSYEHVMDSRFAGNGTAIEAGLAFGGSFNFDVLFNLRSRQLGLSFKADFYFGFGFYSDAGSHYSKEFNIGMNAGVWIPAGGGMLDLSAKVNFSIPLVEDTSQVTATGHAPFALSIGLIAGYAFSL